MKSFNDHNDYLNCLVSEKQAADFLGYTIRALQNWRFRGGGPPFVKVSRRSIRYRRKDLIQWAEDNIQDQTPFKQRQIQIWRIEIRAGGTEIKKWEARRFIDF